MKAVVLDGYTLNPGDLEWAPLKELVDVTIYDRTTYSLDEVPLVLDRTKGADIILTNKTPIPEEVINELPNLKYIGMLSTGFDVVDIKAAKEKNIVVSNIPSYGTDTVSQMAIALLLEICHHVGSHSDSVKQGNWTNNDDWCYWNFPLIELSGKTMGIVGYGRIGQSTGRIAQALGMKVLAYDHYKIEGLESENMKYVDLDELYTNSDVISLHCPLTEENKEMINKDSISIMKDGVIIINNSRGSLINEEDLANALNNNKVGGAALDVVSSEPIKENNPLLDAKNCIITPHISWATKEARQRLFNTAVENVRMFLDGNPTNVVNR
ncbi:D-2-hydroxyacid dehydrogenase [Anaerobacillus isosaccharinicus]|uniref:D-2-hydroxyacid dehydrogenase n=1 Tax=Anaerobacillus isosaccharinicus TaxID=1532552 RepID=A0A1S2M9X3_9BACI|nr:D-2-hydroxyacid dehydrogenase [Anaerobacillus isosaccharinicus]MBA5585026.1 D-2-hydroxyacid dehydrogenase [Anaerobacillus isosaccharinicus]QOY36623.1 D-2-hydroxyacid dehydrogenase [Anaerobacillus isosaccharinicus]